MFSTKTSAIINLIALHQSEEPPLKKPKPSLEVSAKNCHLHEKCTTNKSSTSSAMPAGSFSSSSSDLLTSHHDPVLLPPLNALNYSIYWESTEAKNLFQPHEGETMTEAICKQIKILKDVKRGKENFRAVVRKCLSREVLTTDQIHKFSRWAHQHICAYYKIWREQEQIGNELTKMVQVDIAVLVRVEKLVKLLKMHQCALDFDHNFCKGTYTKL